MENIPLSNLTSVLMDGTCRDMNCSIITTVHKAAWSVCPWLCLRTRLDSHSMWSSYGGQIIPVN